MLANTSYSQDVIASWVDVTTFYKFLINRMGHNPILGQDIIDCPGAFCGQFGFSYQIPYFETFNAALATQEANLVWTESLNSLKHMIQPGDVVFYSQNPSPTTIDYFHVALVIGWGSQTYYPDQPPYPTPMRCDNPVQLQDKPRILDHNGPFQEGIWGIQAPSDGRTLDNTSSVIGKITIVHVQ